MEGLVYHGTPNPLVGRIRCDVNKSKCDFGNGFYTGTLEWAAKNRAVSNSRNEGYVYTFNFINDVSTYIFDDPVLWAFFVAYNRDKKKINFREYPALVREFKRILRYPVIIGNIADDKMSDAFNAFMSSSITDICFAECLKLIRLGVQVVFKDDTIANTKLIPVRCKRIFGLEARQSKDWGLSVKSDMDKDLECLKEEYLGKGLLVKKALAKKERELSGNDYRV